MSTSGRVLACSAGDGGFDLTQDHEWGNRHGLPRRANCPADVVERTREGVCVGAPGKEHSRVVMAQESGTGSCSICQWKISARAAGPKERHLGRNQEIGVQFPGSPLAADSLDEGKWGVPRREERQASEERQVRAHGRTARRRPGVAEDRVQLPVGPLKSVEGSRIRLAGPRC